MKTLSMVSMVYGILTALPLVLLLTVAILSGSFLHINSTRPRVACYGGAGGDVFRNWDELYVLIFYHGLAAK